jgi:oligosaccharide reducing-end xylanase
MRRVALGIVSVLTFAAAVQGQPVPSPPAAGAKALTSDGEGAYATGRYRNLFAEAGHTEQEVEARIARAWERLFRGDEETQRLYFRGGENENGPLAYIPDIQHTDVRSEGMSYGMMIAVQLDRKAEFDALWNWSVTHMYQRDPKHPSHGFFSWQMSYDGSVMDELPAPDGEEYYAMALYFAANRWGSGKGIYDYEAHADRLLRDMVHREPITGPVRQRGKVVTHTVGKEVNDEHGMVLFSPDERNTFTDASYHGVASLAAANEERARKFADALWNLDVPSSRVFRYYDGLLYVMCLLHASGRFRIVLPRG